MLTDIMPEHAGLTCRCGACRAPWWSTALAYDRHGNQCPFCGTAGKVQIRQEPRTDIVVIDIVAEIKPTRPTFPPDVAAALQNKPRVRFVAAQLPEEARWHPALLAALDQITGRPIDGSGRLAAEVLAILGTTGER